MVLPLGHPGWLRDEFGDFGNEGRTRRPVWTLIARVDLDVWDAQHRRDRDSEGGLPRPGRTLVEACRVAGFDPHIVYTSDDIIVEQALVAAGLGVTTIPGLALRSHRAPGVEASEIPTFRRRVLLAALGAPPDPPATAAFIAAFQAAIEQTIDA